MRPIAVTAFLVTLTWQTGATVALATGYGVTTLVWLGGLSLLCATSTLAWGRLPRTPVQSMSLNRVEVLLHRNGQGRRRLGRSLMRRTVPLVREERRS